MSSFRRFRVERKTFEVTFRKDEVEVTERSRAVQITTGLEVSLCEWLIWKLKGVLAIDENVPKTGFLGTRRGKAMDITTNIKKNKGGHFLSILCFSKKFRQGYNCICIPRGLNSSGWRTFCQALEGVAKDRPEAATVQTRRGQVEKIVAEVVPHQTVYELREEWVVLSADKNVDDWDACCTEFQIIAGIDYIPKITVLTKRRALMDVKNEEDRDKFVGLKCSNIRDAQVSFTSWSPGVDTLPSCWFRRQSRWLTFVGIPYHLYSEETVKSLTNRFGFVKSFANLGPVVGDQSGARVLVGNCDVRLVPHFIPLVDLGGVVYPVRILLDLSDATVEEEEAMQPSNNSFSGLGSVRSRTFAEVAAGAGNSGYVQPWRRKHVERHSRSPVSRVAESNENNSGNLSKAQQLIDNEVGLTLTHHLEGTGDNIGAGLGNQLTSSVLPFDLNEQANSVNSRDSSLLRVEQPPVHDLHVPGPDAGCFDALAGLGEQRNWDHVLETDDTDRSDDLTIVANTESLGIVGNNPQGQEGDSHWFDLEAQPLGRLFEIADSEDSRCRSILERVHLNFGQHGKRVKKRRVGIDEEVVDGIGEQPLPNDD